MKEVSHMEEQNVKTFKINGIIKKKPTSLHFEKEVKAVKIDDALEKIYSELGSRHKAKRYEIKIIKIEELKQESRE
ncbi:MAG: 50S ribosomal protein L18Ae [Candidatus Bathyarchaeia archaeon]